MPDMSTAEDRSHLDSASRIPPSRPRSHRERSRSPCYDSMRKDDGRRYRDRDRDRDRRRDVRDDDEPLNDASNRRKDEGRQLEEKRMAKALFTKDKSKSRSYDDDARGHRDKDRYEQAGRSERKERSRDDTGARPSRDQIRDGRAKDGKDDARQDIDQSAADKFGNAAKSLDKPKEKKNRAPPQPQSSEPMILVTVNDRLGTKAQIPCLASDNVGAFKALVAAKIGRRPHEIMLKRQGERPFKDMLSLEDYGVSSGVQLDLELDTGD